MYYSVVESTVLTQYWHRW